VEQCSRALEHIRRSELILSARNNASGPCGGRSKSKSDQDADHHCGGKKKRHSATKAVLCFSSPRAICPAKAGRAAPHASGGGPDSLGPRAAKEISRRVDPTALAAMNRKAAAVFQRRVLNRSERRQGQPRCWVCRRVLDQARISMCTPLRSWDGSYCSNWLNIVAPLQCRIWRQRR
jgi:hypothetical protein